MNNKLKLTLIASSIWLVLGSQQAMATNGYAAHGFGMTQKAMGGTAVAGHDNAMNMATNPAAMSFGENNWTVGVDLFRPSRSTNHAGSPAMSAAQDPFGQGSPATPAADLDGNDDQLFPVPEFAYQRKLNDKFAVGLAVYGNGGMNATYDRSIFGPRTDQTGAPLNADGSPAGANTGIDFSQLFISPSASMKLNDKHAIGVSLNLVYQRITVNGIGGFTPFSRDPSSLSDRDYDNSTGAGLTLGWQGQLSPMVSAGLSYKTKTKMGQFDNYKGLLAEQGGFDIPSMITAGVSIQATPKTTIAIDVAKINYTDVKSISNKNNTAPLQGQLIGQALGQIPPGTPLQGPKLGDDDGAGFGWDDQNIIKIGVKHQVNNKLTLMGGWNHGKAPIGDDQTAFNVLAPATVEDHLTLGVDWKLTNKSNVTVAYMHAFENEIKGSSAQTAQGPVDPGAFIPVGPHPIANASPANIKMYQDAIGVSYTKSF